MPQVRDCHLICPVCKKIMMNNHRGIQCDICDFWHHMVCANLDLVAYRRLSKSNEKWYCSLCLANILPFMSVDDNALIDLCCYNSAFESFAFKEFSVNELVLKNINRLHLIEGGDDDLTPNICSVCNYYDPVNISNNASLSKNVSCIHLNIRSLFKNFLDFSDYLGTLKFKFHIIILTETWLESDNSSCFGLSGYTLFSFPRTHGRGGGVLIYVESSWSSELISYKDNINSFEYGIVNVSNSNYKKSFTIVDLYRPPKSKIQDFNDEFLTFGNFLHDISCKANSSLVVAGDFNVNLLRVDTNLLYSDFLDCMYSIGLLPTISLLTRLTKYSSTLIDNIFVSDPSVAVSGLIYLDISNHLTIFVAFSLPVISHSTNFTTQRPLTNSGLTNLTGQLSSISWDFIGDNSTPDDDYETFIKIIISNVNNCLPISNVKNIRPSKNWLTPGLKKSCHTRRILYYAALKDKNLWDKYKLYRNKLNFLIRERKKTYISEFVFNHRCNAKAVWQLIKSFGSVV